jgi:hypothetical protein
VALWVAAVVAGAAVGAVLRSRAVGPAPALRRLGPLVAGIAGALAADRLEGDVAVTVAVGAQLLLVAGVLANRTVSGATLLAVGLGLNLVSMAVDGGVPVDGHALVRAGVLDERTVDAADFDGPRHLQGDGDMLPWLGDAVPVAALGTVVSVGDLVTLAGTGWVTAGWVRSTRRRPCPDPSGALGAGTDVRT